MHPVGFFGLSIYKALRSTTLGEYSIPKGTFVIPQASACHFDSKSFENPELFNPTRFIHSKKERGWFPFSEGSRVCLGKKFALLEIVLTLAVILKSLSFSLPEGYVLKKKKFALVNGPANKVPLHVSKI